MIVYSQHSEVMLVWGKKRRGGGGRRSLKREVALNSYLGVGGMHVGRAQKFSEI